MDKIRNILSISSGVAILAVVSFSVLGLMLLSSGSVMAASISISSDSLATDDGDIDGVTVDASGEITWDGAEEQPKDTTVKLQVQSPDGSEWETIETTSDDLSGLAGTYSFSFSDVDVTDGTEWTKSDFVSSNDGAAKSTELSFRLKVVSQGDINGDGNNPDTATSNSATTTLTVNNEESSTGFSASGSVNGEGNDEDPEDNEQEEDD